MLARPLALLLILAACSSTPAPAPDASPDVADVAADLAPPDALDAGRDAQIDVLPPPDSAFDVPDAPDAANDRPHTSDPPPSPADDVMDVPGEAADTTDVMVIDAPDASDAVADAPVDAADAGPLTCPAGRGDCDGNAANGCETDLDADTMHCGRCNLSCPESMVMVTSCVAGRCQVTGCGSGLGDCDGLTSNGCETSIATSAANCGVCGRACALPNVRTQLCRDGTCRAETCTTNYGDCDSDPANGCETDLRTAVANCGVCGTRCSFPHMGATCDGGSCVATGRCDTGWANCDGVLFNGCETDISGANPRHCGACGRACVTGASTTANVCVAGACMPTCAVGFSDCDSNTANGCETSVYVDATNCGTCGRRCTGETSVCRSGVCVRP